MKRLVLIISAILSLVTLQAQTSDGYLTDGDIVTIAYDYWGAGYRYLEASADGIRTAQVASDKCFWEIGITENNSEYFYTFKSLATNRYLGVKDNGNQNYSMILSDAPTSYRQSEANNNAERAYLYGKFYYTAANNVTVYLNWEGDNYHLQTWWSHPNYIEKWNKEGADAPGGGFYPETLIFPYASNDSEAQVQNQEVTFTIPETAVVSYQCVNRPDEIIGGGHNDVNEGDITAFRLYWESSNTTTSEINQSNYYTPNPSDGYVLPDEGTEVLTLTEGAAAGTKIHTFTITPVGKSPMNLRTNTNNRIQWVNYADRVVAEYKYKGNTVKQTMRVVRNSYHEEPLPPLTFHVNPTMFTFGKSQETVNITVVPIHQHGSVIYDVNQNVFKTEYEEHTPAYPELLSLTSPTDGWVITTDDGADWLSHTVNTNSIAITAQALGNGLSDRTATFTGTFKRENAGSGHEHQESFTIQLAQRSDAGIQFNKKSQEVHTATRTIYYLPEDRIELRLAESNFFGYMRCYDYHTGKAPNYNFGNNDPTYGNYNYATSWYTTPRGANNQPFTPINTPASAATESTEGRSWGLYAINHNHGGILNEGTENSNNIPVLNGWNYTYTKGSTYSTEPTKRAAGYHTIACDVSAYTDYEITTDGGVVKSITEPTLSYRQLFDLRPAGEMADKFAALESGKYLEEYHYQAPAGKNILLTPQFKYRKGTNDEYLSKLCYFYWDSEDLVRVENATWSGDNIISDNGEYLTVLGNAGETKTYTLTANSGNVRIAKFTVTFTDSQITGPSRTVLKSDYEIANIYSRKAHIDFNYTDDSKKTTLSDGFTYYNQPLDAAESTYGFVYTKGDLAQPASDTHHGFVRAANQGVFPFYGEYVLVNGVNKSWNEAGISAENHGGKDKGFALYVDGTTEPGLVVSISAPANICSGQTMYCSAWLCNPSNAAHQGSNPIFRFNVQGRETGQTEWEDAGVFFVGELPKGSGWQQVVFPIESAHSYDETRVSLYNFATSGAANDFMVDDITLFASRLPLASYQAQTNCASDANTPSSTAAILRIDYTVFEGIADHYMYYQIYNTSKDHVVELTKLDGASAYYHDVDGETNRSYGSVQIPNKTFDPETFNASASEQEKVLIFTTVQSFKDYLVDQITEDQKHVKGKAYIRSTIKGQERWLLYVMHIIPNAKAGEDSSIPSEQENKYLWERYDYALRMANVPEELAAAECNMQTPLHATQATHFDLYNGYNEQIADDFIPESANNCANDYYTLQAKIENSISPGTGGTIQQIEGAVMGDWLVGYPFDDVYINTETRNDKSHKDSIETARTEFYKTYGYYREEVTSAIVYDLRRNDPANTNRLVTKFEELDANAFEYPARNYAIIKNLYEKGLLILGQSQTSFYLASKDTARYWFFPIDGTATGIMKDMENKDVTVMLQDCTEPIWVRVSSKEQPNYFANIAPLEKEKQTSLQKIQLPTVRITKTQADNGTITIPVTDIGSHTSLAGLEDNKITINLNNIEDVAFVDMESGRDIAKPELVIGQKYLMRMRMKDGDNVHIGGNSENCRVGTIYFYLMILPNTVVWTPATGSYNGWGLDENWRGWNDKDADGVYDAGDDAGELMEVGFVPVAGSDVIIPTLPDVTLYPYIHDHNHYPMDVNAHPSICKNIYFAPGAHIHNQHLLQYEKAFVDMTIPKGNWYMMSAPLQKMYSGDMYVPHEGTWNSGSSLEIDDPFATGAFQGARSSTSAYAFWASYYNQSVKTWYEDGGYIESTSSSFQQSNGLNQPLEVGSGFALWGEGADVAAGENIVIRLPKQEETYSTSSGTQVSVPRDGKSHKLAFTATQDAEKSITPMTITLTNTEASEHFIFGNPTMAFINMHDFLHDNEGVLNHTFYRLEGATWSAETEHTMGDNRFLAPMTSVMLETKNKEKSQQLEVQLSPSHLTLTDMENPFDEHPEVPAPVAPRARVSEEDASEVMSIYAYTNNAYARTVLATTPVANDYYLIGEDALFVSSGVESSSYVTTPLNMYTVAEQVPMMADVRQGISQIPMGLLVANGYRTSHLQIAFYLSANWSRECYFCDSKTGQKIRIMDGLVITVEMPQNHEQRYYIEGPDAYVGSNNDDNNGGVTSSTTQPSIMDECQLSAYSPEVGVLVVNCNEIIRELKVYDMTGQLIAYKPLDLFHSSVNMSTPSGMCVVAATLRDGTTRYVPTLVR